MGAQQPVPGAGRRPRTDEVPHAYAAVHAGSPPPAVEGLEGASRPFAVAHGALALFASRVPAAFFAAGTGRAADAGWAARQAARHHEVCRALAFRALPLAFGAVLFGEGARRQWHGARAQTLEGVLVRAEGCAEWTVVPRDDTARLDAYLHRADADVAGLHAAAAQAGPAARALLQRRLALARAGAAARPRRGRAAGGAGAARAGGDGGARGRRRPGPHRAAAGNRHRRDAPPPRQAGARARREKPQARPQRPLAAPYGFARKAPGDAGRDLEGAAR